MIEWKNVYYDWFTSFQRAITVVMTISGTFSTLFNESDPNYDVNVKIQGMTLVQNAQVTKGFDELLWSQMPFSSKNRPLSSRKD